MNNGGTGSLFLDLAFATVVVVTAVIFIGRNWRGLVYVTAGVGVFVVGIGLLLAALGLLAYGGLASYESYKTKQCQTVYERVAKAKAAPADYFGDQMRRDTDAEQASCNDLAKRLSARAKG